MTFDGVDLRSVQESLHATCAKYTGSGFSGNILLEICLQKHSTVNTCQYHAKQPRETVLAWFPCYEG